MLRRFSVNFAILSMLLDTSLTIVALLIAVFLRPFLTNIPLLSIPPVVIEIPIWLYIMIALLWAIIFLLTSVYDPRRIYKVTDEFQQVTIAVGLAALMFAGMLFLTLRDFSRWLFILFLVIDLVLLLGWRVLTRLLFRLGDMPVARRRVLVVGSGKVGQRIGDMLMQYRWTGLDFAGYLDDDSPEQDNELPILGKVDEVRQLVEAMAIDDVVIALPQRAYGKVNELVLSLHDVPVNMRVVPDYFSLALYRATVEDFGGVPMINLRDPALNDVQRMIKRLFDLIVCSFLVLLLSPLLTFIAMLIKLDSPGPIIFRQQRVGENGRLFGMFKFRSMVVGAEKLQDKVTQVTADGKIIHKQVNDPRITRVGRILRRTSLDEFPQLFNVLKGEMSLVGPRPELPWLVGQYELWQHKRLSVPQGMTGWWQVNGRSDRLMHLHTEDDIYYIQNYSLWMDIYILLKTPWVVVRGKGAY